MSVFSVSGISANQIRELSSTFATLVKQAGYAQDVHSVLQKAISLVSDEYLRVVFALMDEMVTAKFNVLNTYMQFNNQLLDLRMNAIQYQLAPERGNYLFRTYA